MAISIVRSKGQITIPLEVRKAARLEEGDPVEIEMTSEGILIRPKKVIDATQAWFWASAWQAGEAAASADIEAGRVEVFETAEELLSALEE